LARYRLRFHLQEVDLQRGSTYIGRSEECEVTIEDPLVSRKHARILFEGDDVTLEDLESRNGVRVNGKQIKGSQKLTDGDRVRIGTQDFVFCRVQQKIDRQSKTTGVLRLCGQCKAPYAREVVSCPNCGAIEATDEETLSGAFGPSSQYSWSVQLLVEALQKALGLGRFADADRILRRATALLEERIASGGKVQPLQLPPLAVAAERICKETQDPAWGDWMAAFCVRADMYPPAEVTEQIIAMRLRHEEMTESVDRLLAYCRSTKGPESREDREAVQRLGRVQSGSDEETMPPGAVAPKPN
jgi:FHA domain-containing protein